MTYEQYTNGNAVARRSPQEIQSDLREIRGEIQGTLQALGSQLQPGQLLHQVWESLRGGGGAGRFFKNLGRTVEENPLPVVLIGASFGYLIYADSRQRHPESHRIEVESTEGSEKGARARSMAHEGAERMRSLKEGAQGSARKLRSGAHDLGENVRGKLQATRTKAREMGSYTQEEWRHMGARARQAGERGRDLVHEQPLILAGLGLALGAAVAAMAPMSRKEHQLLGTKGRELKEQARHAAHEATDKAKAIGSEALRSAKAEASSQTEAEHTSEGGGESGIGESGTLAANAPEDVPRGVETFDPGEPESLRGDDV